MENNRPESIQSERSELNELAEDVLCNGNASRWSELYPHVQEICRRVCTSPRCGKYADDVTQKTCVNITTTSRPYKRGQSFTAWCSTIAYNALVDILRKETRERIARKKLKDQSKDAPASPAWPQWYRFFDQHQPLANGDLNKSQALFDKKPKKAVMIFAATGLCLLLPQETWKGWLTRCEMEWPWPDEDILRAGEKWGVYAHVGARFGIQPDSVRTEVEQRYRDFFLSLDRVRAELDYRE